MLMYRKDLADKAGVKLPERPTWDQVQDVAAKIHDPKAGVYGICLRGKPGWGDNMAFLTTMVNTYGGQWFDMSWKPQLETKPWKDAITFYVDLLKNYGPPGSSANSFNEILALYNEGKCGMWVDATIAASFITDPKQSKVADKVAFAQAPVRRHAQGRQLAVGLGAGDPGRLQEGRRGAEVHHLGDVEGLHQPGRPRRTAGARCRPARASRPTRTPEFLKAAKFAEAEKKAIDTRQPERQHAAEVPVRRRAVRGHPRVPGDRHRGGPADERGAVGQGHGRPGAEDLADRGRTRDEEGRLLQVSRSARCACRRQRRTGHRPLMRPGAAMNRLLPRALMAPAVRHALPLDDRAAGDDAVLLARALQPDAARRQGRSSASRTSSSSSPIPTSAARCGTRCCCSAA